MAREQGTFNFSANFEVQIEGTLDARQLVDDFADLLNFTSEDNYIPLGFPVAVKGTTTPSERGIYVCVNNTALSTASSWNKLAFASDIPDAPPTNLSFTETINGITIESSTGDDIDIPFASVAHGGFLTSDSFIQFTQAATSIAEHLIDTTAHTGDTIVIDPTNFTVISGTNSQAVFESIDVELADLDTRIDLLENAKLIETISEDFFIEDGELNNNKYLATDVYTLKNGDSVLINPTLPNGYNQVVGVYFNGNLVQEYVDYYINSTTEIELLLELPVKENLITVKYYTLTN